MRKISEEKHVVNNHTNIIFTIVYIPENLRFIIYILNQFELTIIFKLDKNVNNKKII